MAGQTEREIERVLLRRTLHHQMIKNPKVLVRIHPLSLTETAGDQNFVFWERIIAVSISVTFEPSNTYVSLLLSIQRSSLINHPQVLNGAVYGSGV
ncbi:hypothetical protein HS088_TW09G00613 [Tripterygium wilfordii]|uniref:Uncharacterized protein n=1 Tax=Tripterygium wilfordii TaxID=458696 RepID=A0A7J7D8A1_TRIWF|nr:hypothetical protein HS088_TW09G00613 [Tripterygium wilfordii]